MKPAWLISSHGEDGAELEALQTDVMRFVAILGLCLAAIFSLVQALGTSAPPSAPSLVSAEILQQQLRALSQRNAQLAVELSELQRTLVGSAQRESAHQDTVTALEQARQQQQAELAVLARSLTDQTLSVQEARRRLRAEAKRSSQLETALAENTSVAAKTPPRPAKANQVMGISLGFASNAVLTDLLQTGDVVLYANNGSRYWRLGRDLGHFNPSEPPQQFYQMRAETVPAEIISRFQPPTVGQRTGYSWGVTLPDSTVAEIKRAIDSGQGGELLISADASVDWDVRD